MAILPLTILTATQQEHVHTYHFSSEQLRLDGRPQSAGSGPDDQHPGAGARLPLSVALVRRSSIELLPERLRPPRGQVRPQLGVEKGEGVRPQMQQVAHVAVVAEDRLEGVGVEEVLEALHGLRGILGAHRSSALLLLEGGLVVTLHGEAPGTNGWLSGRGRKNVR